MVSIKIPSSSNSSSKEHVVCLFGGMGDNGRVFTMIPGATHQNMVGKIWQVVPHRLSQVLGRASESPLVSSSRMLIFGGLGKTASGPKMLNDLWEFNYKTQTWKELTTFAKKN